MPKAPKLIFLAIVLLSTPGCLVIGPRTVSVAELQTQPPSLMVAKRSDRLVYLVLDPARVPLECPVLVQGEDRGGRLQHLHTFVERDLKRAFENYFQTVRVVGPAAKAPPGSVVVDVAVKRVEINITSKAINGYGNTVHSAGVGALTWSAALRLAESDEYLFSFAGQSVGTPTDRPQHAVRTMLESAITDFFKGYTDKKVHRQLLGAPAVEEKPSTI
ncbi:MAG: hypothetical protein H6707_20250 [Deltaproteobacteria bacterium]|nr:hypothetical protein [Deltaproteobacteria bacterium]